MSQEMPFIIYCIEEYKTEKGLKGKAVIELFSKYHVFDYIFACYEALHTTGVAYTINDIDMYIKEQQKQH